MPILIIHKIVGTHSKYTNIIYSSKTLKTLRVLYNVCYENFDVSNLLKCYKLQEIEMMMPAILKVQ